MAIIPPIEDNVTMVDAIKQRRFKRLEVSPELFFSFLQGISVRRSDACFPRMDESIPEDCQVCGSGYDLYNDVFLVRLAHPSFPIVPEASAIERLSPMFSTLSIPRTTLDMLCFGASGNEMPENVKDLVFAFERQADQIRLELGDSYVPGKSLTECLRDMLALMNKVMTDRVIDMQKELALARLELAKRGAKTTDYLATTRSLSSDEIAAMRKEWAEMHAGVADSIAETVEHYPSPDVARDDGIKIGARKIAALIRERTDEETVNSAPLVHHIINVGLICADCGVSIAEPPIDPPGGWELEDGRTVCSKCCSADLREISLLASRPEYRVIAKQEPNP